MAKIIEGAAMIAGAIVLDIYLPGSDLAFAGWMNGMVAYDTVIGLAVGGAALMTAGIAEALHANNTGQQGISSHQHVMPWRIVYGRQRVTGTTFDLSLSDGGNGDNRWLWEAQAIAAHAVKGIPATYLDQQQAFCVSGTNGLTGNLIGTASTNGGDMGVGGMVLAIHPTDLNFREYSNFYWDGNPRFWMAQYDGTQPQADPFYMALCATGGGGTPHWDSSCIAQGVAYSLNRYWANSHWTSGKPNVRYDVEGKNDIFDPRNGTYSYTENAALVLADYMCNQKYGMMFSYSDFDTDNLIAVANICDETVTLTNPQIIFNQTYTTEARYTINGTFSTSEDGGMVIEEMLSAMAGRISYIGGKWSIFPGVWQGTSGIQLGVNDLTGSVTWRPNRKARDLYNEVRATFICPSGWDTTYAPGFDVYNVVASTVEDNFNGQWSEIDMPPFCLNALRDYGTDPYLTEDGNEKYIHNTRFAFTISVAAAQRLSKIMLMRNRYQGTGTLNLPIRYLGIQPNDVIELTYPRYSWVNKQLEVQRTQINVGSTDSNGKYVPPSITIDVAEVDSSIYNWNAADELKLQGGQSVAGPTQYSLPAPTNLVLESGNVSLKTSNGTVNAKSAIVCTWTPSNDAHVSGGGYQILDYQVAGSSFWIHGAQMAGDMSEYTITGVNDGQAYNVRLRSMRKDGYGSEYVQAGPITVSDSSLTVSASDTFYSDGKSVALLEPSMPGANVTEAMTTIFVGNPGFEAGDIGWSHGTQAVIAQSGANSGSWAMAMSYTGGASGGADNQTLVPVKEGQVLNAQVMIDASASVGGSACVRVSFHDSTKATTGGYVDGSHVAAGTSGYQMSSVIAVCPPGVAYVHFTLISYSQQSGTVYFDDCHMAFQSTTLDEVPNGPGFSKVAAPWVNGVNRPLIDFADAHTNNTLDYVSNGATYSRVGSAWVNGGNRPLIDLADAHVNKTAAYIPYSNGATVDSLMPYQAGADVTYASGYVTLQNPYFAQGGRGWVLQQGWSIQPSSANTFANGSTYYALYSGSTTSGIGNMQSIPATEGDVITANAFVSTGAGPSIGGSVRVVWYDANNNALTIINGSNVIANAPSSSRCVTSAPAGTAYALVDFAVYTTTACTISLYSVTADLQLRSQDELPDGSSFHRVAAGQLTNNQIDFNLSYLNKGALATLSTVANGQLQNGGIFGVGGQSAGGTVYNSATNQDLPVNFLWNNWFYGTPGDAVGAASNADGQPALPAGSGLSLWQNNNTSAGTAVWYGQGIVLLPQTSVSGQESGITQTVYTSWLGLPGNPFVASVQVAWADTTQPNGDIQILLGAYGTSGFTNLVSGGFPATAFSSTQFQTIVLEGTLPAQPTGYDTGYIMLILSYSTAGDYLLMRPMLAPGSIVSAWTSLTPTSPIFAPTAPGSTAPVYTAPSGGSGSPAPGTGYCPTLDMLLLPGLTVADAEIGQAIDCVDTDSWELYKHPIESLAYADRECVRITADDGASLDVSIETPFTLPDGSTLMAQGMLGQKVFRYLWVSSRVARRNLGRTYRHP